MPREKPGLQEAAPSGKSRPAPAAFAESEQRDVYWAELLALLVAVGCFFLMAMLGLLNLLDRIWQ
jgi:hypothetical protein